MSYPEDPYKLKEKTNSELHDWLAGYEPETDEYIAGIEESMRRVAVMEELMEKNEAPVWRRELIAMCVAVVSIAAAIIAIVITYQ